MTPKNIFCLAALLTVISTACTSKDANTIEFASPLKFTYDSSLVGSEFAAKVDKEEITNSQLYSPSPALQELEERINKIVMTMAYEKAVAAKGETQTVITFGFAEPKETLATLLKNKLDKDIEVKFDPTAKHQAADIGGKVVTREELAQQNLLLGKLMTESYTQKLQGLEGILSRRMILQASKAANISMEDYIKKNVLGNSDQVTDQEVKDYANKNNISEKELTEEMAEQLKGVIRGRRRDKLIAEYVGKNLLKSPIKVGFRETHTQLASPKVEAFAPSKGAGPIEITLLSHFECKECRDVEAAMYEVASGQPKYYRLNYVFNLPDNNPEERMIAEAALCLRKQKDDYFWAFMKALSQSKGGAIEEDLNTTAKSLGADPEQFRACFLAREFKDTVESHVQKSKELGFYRSPVVLLDGRVYESPVSTQEVVDQAQEIRVAKGLGFNFFYKIKKMFQGT